jgi:hypothetical protein
VGRWIRALSLVVALALPTAGRAQEGAPAGALPEGEPLAVEASAIVPIDAETSVSIVGVQGQIIVSARDDRELRVVSRLPGAQGGETTVGVWQAGTKMIIAPSPGQTSAPRVLRVEVPRAFAVAIDASHSELVVDSVGGDVDLNGRELRATVHSCNGTIDVELAGGNLGIQDSAAATLRLRGTVADVGRMSGEINVHAVGGEVTLRELHSMADVVTDGVKLVIVGGDGGFHVKANQGSVGIKSTTEGGELELSGAPLRLNDCKGDITVTSDSSAEFTSMAAGLHFDMYGGTLRGKGNLGILEVRTRNTEINVESIEQGMRVQGDGLKARLVDVGGELYVEASVSDVAIDRAAAVELRLDRGSATIQRTGGPVKATVVGGDVHIIDGIGPVQLDIDGGDAEVSWSSISGDKDSNLVNKSGAITVRFPVAGSCRVDAKSSSGRVESTLPTVKVADDFESAQGPVNGGYRPLIRVAAYGDIRLLDGSQPADEH